MRAKIGVILFIAMWVFLVFSYARLTIRTAGLTVENKGLREGLQQSDANAELYASMKEIGIEDWARWYCKNNNIHQ
jgi:fatty acid desaturase